MNSNMDFPKSEHTQPIAIIGLNLKFPGDATSPEAFWDMLQNARNASTKVPPSRFNVDAFYHPDPARLDSMRVPKAHFMNEDPRAFDAAFFNMSPAEASILDPQQRGLLEGTYHTFENAGLSIERVAGSRTSVFCASFGRDSDAIVARDPEFQSRYQATSSGSSMLSNRISHFFDLRGPSLTVDTACSSGLYALHLACQSILTGESDMGLVCGSNTYLTPECMSFPLSNAGFLSPDGRSYSFDRKANGYARGEGYAFVLLKPLKAALRDGDTIRSIIRATGVNQDGRTPSITQPSAAAQVELIKKTYETAGLSLSETEYVEAHGTGTPVGDPIEASAIGQVFRSHRNRPVWIGSVKSNVGHLEGASGLAGLLKAVFALENSVVPPIADFEEANPAIDVDELGISFPTKPTPWPVTESGIRRASISSFGYGGSNAHAVLDDAYNYLRTHGLSGHHRSVDSSRKITNGTSTNGAHTNGTEPNRSKVNGKTENGNGQDGGVSTSHCGLLTFSAADEDGTHRQVSTLENHLAQHPISSADALVDLAHTLSRRSLLSWRAFAVVESSDDLKSTLGKSLSPVIFALPSKTPELGFVFTGQGAQYSRMGLGLLQYQVFRQSLLDCNDYLRSLGCECPVNVTLSGPVDAIEKLLRKLDSEEIFARKLSVEVGYHSKTMEAVAAEYQEKIQDIHAPPQVGKKASQKLSSIALYSSTTGELVPHLTMIDPAYWVRNLVSPVLFSYAISSMGGAKQEAARQLAAAVESRIVGYQLDNVRFLRAINVSDSERGTEAKVVLRRRRQATNTSGQMLCYDWRVFGTNGDNWDECAYGSIKVELEPEQGVTPEQAALCEARRARFASTIYNELQEDAEQCRLSVHHSQLYKNMSRRSGFDYGPYFQLLRNIGYDRDGHATATLSLRDYTKTMSFAGEDPCVVHPSTLDAICHLQMVALSQGGWNAVPTMMFSHLRKLWVSHKLFRAQDNPQLKVATHETMRAFREAECRTTAMLAKTSEPVIVLDGQRGTAISSLSKTNVDIGSDKDSKQLFYSLDYKPDLSLLTETEKSKYLTNAFEQDPRCKAPDKGIIDRADAIALHFIEAALNEIDQNDQATKYDGHLERYVAWMRRVRQSREKWTLESRGLGGLDIQDILEKADSEPTQRLTKKVGEHLYRILRGEENALQIIFEGNLADEFYHSNSFQTNNSKMGAYMSILSHAQPNIRVLEVGAGTGSSTGRILPYLSVDGEEWGPSKPVRFGEYVYTDVSAGFFEKARERFSYAADHMTFRKLDLEQNPFSQGFDKASYDVVVAGNVLHATSDLIQTLRYVRSLLRPGGFLILGETVNLDNVRDGLIFGLLPGWWLRDGQWWSTNEEYQDQGPLLTEKQWDVVLREAGFPGVQITFRDHEERPHHRVSVMMTSRTEDETTSEDYVNVAPDQPCGNSSYGIVIDPSSDIQRVVAETLRETLTKELEVRAPEVITMGDVISNTTKLQDRIIISLLELEGSILKDISETTFTATKMICLDTKSTLWVTRGASPNASVPASDIATGFGRSVCSERGDQNFTTLSLSTIPTAISIPTVVDHITRVLKHHRPGLDNESEFSETAEGILCIPRLTPTSHLEQTLSQRHKMPEPKTYTTTTPTPAKPHISASIDTPGLLDTLFYAESSQDSGDLADGEVEIEIKATSLNFKDVMIALGQIPGRSFGFDGAGIISRTAQNSALRPGDAVLFCSSKGGGFGTFVRCPELQTEKIPQGMGFHVAAAIPAVWSTAVYSLDHIARLQKGETVLIHSAAGGVGQAAVQLALLRGAEVFATVGNEAKRQLVKDLFGLNDDHIFNSRDDTFAEDVLHATKNRGVDVVLNSLGGELLRQSWECIAPFGRFIDIGKADIIANNTLPMGPFNKNVTFSAVDLVVVHEEAKPLMKRILQDVVRLFEEHPGLAEPKPLHVFSPSKLEDAMRFLQGGKNTGKVVIDFDASDELVYRPSPQPGLEFRGDATYIVSGGLGGLGQEIVRWMGRADAMKFIEELEGTHEVKILAPACDITNRTLLAETLRQARETLPPVRGCIQAAMLLRDDMLANMSAATFHAALDPKYLGSQNLHELLPPDLDFFIMLSSFCGIMGNRGQSNYAAGNAFEDALARHRVARGLKGVAVDLMLVAEAGWANVNYESVTQSLRAGHGGLTQAQLMALLEMLCDPAYDCSRPGAAQVVNMVDSPAELARMTGLGLLDWMQKPIFNNLLRMGETDDSDAAGGRGAAGDDKGDEVDYLGLVRTAADLTAAGEVVTQGLVQKLGKSLSVPAETLDVGKPAYVVGVDSLIAVEVRYWFMKRLNVEVPVFEILKNQSITELCQQVASKVLQGTAK
ncbi:Compactin diketide synthase [Colletotrichum sp. SAR 10_86]|nr:Compactin diketide synthase [Colletotrichum sp. SAR 10_65]KAI8198442.1 Compactin diketide synthase [Colletotrichum sp. SAR 10_76]KAI8216798.1 Compactin diketide synthase [Colletotrichum sp. SAR 10_77]KAI8219110.1 Compactin diketide synthase [Colletotrichum sp. SAR 10_86]KAJ4995642.1 Compactin diketide synthase [Colletotrichum sp. SAR 10_66]